MLAGEQKVAEQIHNQTGDEVVLSDCIDQSGFGLYQVGVVLFCFLVTVFDGFDTQAIAFTGPAVAGYFGVDSAGLAPIITAGVVGMAFGAILFGPLGDRFGRRQAVIWATIAFGLFSLATAWAQSVDQLILFRFLTGIGMGGATPNVLALASEFSPDKKRGIVMLLATLGLPVGAIVGAQMASVILGDGCCLQAAEQWSFLPTMLFEDGWRMIFFIGGAAPLLFAAILYWVLPESPYFLAGRGDHERVRRQLSRINSTLDIKPSSWFSLPEAAQSSGIRELFQPHLLRNTLAIWAVYFFNWIAWFSIILWLPSVLVATGLGAAEAANGTKIINGAALLFILPLAWYIPRLPLRAVIVGLLLAGVVGMAVLAGAGQNWPLVYIMIGLTGLFVGGPQICLNYLAVKLYPTSARATGVGWAIGIGRVGTIVGAAIGGPLLVAYGAKGFYLMMIVPLVVSAIAALMVKPVDQTAVVVAGH